MAYRVEFPPDIEKEAEISSGLSLPKNSGNSGKDGNDNQFRIPPKAGLSPT